MVPYLCTNLDTDVRANGRSISLRKLCNEIEGKKIKISKLEVTKGDQNGCIQFIKIDYKKRGLGLF